MYRSRVFWSVIAAGALVGAGLLWWPSGGTPTARPAIALYYADAQGMFLVPATTAGPPATEPGAWAEAVFTKLKQPPRPGLVAPVDAATTLAAATYAAPTWTLTLVVPKPSGSTGERLMTGSLVKTFVGGWPGAKNVAFKLLDARRQPLASQHLDMSEPLALADVQNTVGGGEPAAGGVKSTLWWPSRDGGDLVPVQLALPRGTGIPPRDALDRLMAGPPAEAGSFLAPVAKAGLKASWRTLDAGVAAVELDGELPDGPDGRRFVEATVLTLTEFDDVRAVQFEEDGKPATETVGPYRLQAPLPRPDDVNGDAI